MPLGLSHVKEPKRKGAAASGLFFRRVIEAIEQLLVPYVQIEAASVPVVSLKCRWWDRESSRANSAALEYATLWRLAEACDAA